MSDVEWLHEGEERAWRGLQMMQMGLNAALARDLSAHSQLSYQDYVVLVALTDRPDGEMRVFELGQVLGWEKSRVSHQVSRMEERALVRKHVSCADRRGQVVSVTPYGREAITAAAPSHLRAVRRLFVDRLSPAQLAEVAQVAETVLGALAEEASGNCSEEADNDEAVYDAESCAELAGPLGAASAGAPAGMLAQVAQPGEAEQRGGR